MRSVPRAPACRPRRTWPCRRRPTANYNTEFNSGPYYAADPFRASDHDPLIIGISLSGPPTKGDMNGDGVVDAADRPGFLAAFGSRTGMPRYDAVADMNDDGVVNGRDYPLFYRAWRLGSSR